MGDGCQRTASPWARSRYEVSEHWTFARRLALALLLLCILGRFLAVGLEGVRANSNSSAYDQRSFLNLGLKIRAGRKLTDGNRHPLYPALLALFARREWAYFTGAKLLSLGLGALSLLLIFWLARRLQGSEVALGVILLLSVNQAFVHESSHVMAESLLVGLFFLAWYLTARGFERGQLWVAAGAAAGLAYLTKTTGQLLPIACLPTMLLICGRGIRRAWRDVLGYLAAYSLIAAPLWAYNLARYSNPFYNYSTAHVMWFDHWEDKYAQGPLPTLGSYLRTHSPAEMLSRLWSGLGGVLSMWGEAALPWGRRAGPWQISPWWGALFLGGLAAMTAYGVRRARRDPRLARVACAGALFLLFTLLFAWYAQVYVAPRFLMPLVPILYLLCLEGAQWLGRWLRGPQALRRWAYLSLTLGVAAWLGWGSRGALRQLGQDPFLLDRERNAAAEELLAWLEGETAPGTDILWGPSDSLPSWRYEGAFDFREFPSDMADWEELRAYVQAREARYAIVDDQTVIRRKGLLEPFFDIQDGRVLLKAIPPGWALTYVQPGLPCRWCVFQLLDQQPISQPLLLTLGGQIRLLGYGVARTRVRAGGHLHFTLYWQSLAAIREDYTVFTHLLSPEGALLAQVDRQPLQGRVPTSRWLPGGVYADRFDMPLPPDVPPSEARLEVGLYRLATLERLPVVTPDGQRLPEDRVLLPTPIIIEGATRR